MSTQDCLTLLGLTQLPTRSGLKTAYYNQIKIWHPDHYFSDPQQFAIATEKCKRINCANEHLSELIKSVRNIPNKKSRRPTSASNGGEDVKRTYPSGFPNKDVAEVYLKSKRIISAGYCNASKTLYLKSKGGIVVGYFHVHHSIFSALLNSKFPEKYAETHIYNHFASARL